VSNVVIAAGFGAITAGTLAVALQLSNQDPVGHYAQLSGLVGVLSALALIAHLALPDLLNVLVSTLAANDVIGQVRGRAPYNDFRAFVDTLGKSLNWPFWTIICGVLGAGYVPYRDLLAPMVAFTPSRPARFWALVAYGVGALAIYWGAMSIIRIAIICLHISRLARCFVFRVRPLHPDGCGGFRQIGHLFARLVELAALIALVVVAIANATQETGGDWLRRLEWWALGFVYLVLLPMLVIALLLVPHQAMVRARDAVVNPLSRAFEVFVQKTRLPGDDQQQISSKSQQLSQIADQVKTLNEAYPVWPIEILRLRQVAVTAVLPIVIPAATAIILRFVSGPSR
jgi:hypothetical protein